MADFEKAFEKMIHNEGGYRLSNTIGDHGGMTYAGISRKYHPDWPGWDLINSNDPALTAMVKDFYHEKYWNKIQGGMIQDQSAAEALFDFAVSAGVKTAVKLAQITIGTTPDGIIGPESLAKLNSVTGFEGKYFVAKTARYAEICNRDPSQKKFLLGWINRALKGIS